MSTYAVMPETPENCGGFQDIFDTLEEAVEVCKKYNKKARRGLCGFREVIDINTKEVVYHD